MPGGYRVGRAPGAGRAAHRAIAKSHRALVVVPARALCQRAARLQHEAERRWTACHACLVAHGTAWLCSPACSCNTDGERLRNSMACYRKRLCHDQVHTRDMGTTRSTHSAGSTYDTSLGSDVAVSVTVSDTVQPSRAPGAGAGRKHTAGHRAPAARLSMPTAPASQRRGGYMVPHVFAVSHSQVCHHDSAAQKQQPGCLSRSWLHAAPCTVPVEKFVSFYYKTALLVIGWSAGSSDVNIVWRRHCLVLSALQQTSFVLWDPSADLALCSCARLAVRTPLGAFITSRPAHVPSSPQSLSDSSQPHAPGLRRCNSRWRAPTGRASACALRACLT